MLRFILGVTTLKQITNNDSSHPLVSLGKVCFWYFQKFLRKIPVYQEKNKNKNILSKLFQRELKSMTQNHQQSQQ